MLIVACCVVVVLATVVIGIEQVLLNTDRWAGAVGPLASDPAVQSSLADAAATQAMTALDAQIKSLPGPLQRLAAPAASSLDSFVHDQSLKVVQSPQFAEAWIALNRAGHAALVQLLRGEAQPGAALTVSDGDLQLSLLALMPGLVERVLQQPTSVLPTPPTDFGYVSLGSASALETAQQLVRLLDRSAWLLVIAAIGLILITLAVSPDRRVTAFRIAIGVAIGMALTGLGVLAAQTQVVSSIAGRPISGALQAAVSAVMLSLAQFLLVVLIAAGVVALVAYVVGRRASVRELDRHDLERTIC